MGNQQRKVEAHTRQLHALELRKAGVTYEGIAKQLGYRSPEAAFQAVKAALKSTLQEPAEGVREMELKRLDDMLLAMWPQVKSGNQGAIDRCLRIQERRSRLLGLDAPTKIAPTDPTGEHEYHELTDAERALRVDRLLDAARERRAGSPPDDSGS